MNKKIIDDEVDILGIILTIWNGKWKIVLITLAVIIILGGSYSRKKPTYTATTEIQPISVFEEFKYSTFNSIKDQIKLESFFPSKNFRDQKNSSNSFFIPGNKKEFNLLISEDIEKSYLLSLFIDKLSQGETFRGAIKKFNLINKENYTNDQSYEDSVTKLASSITLLPPQDGPEAHDVREYWQIQFSTQNREDWQKVIQYIEKPTNEEIRIYLNSVFEMKIKLKNLSLII